MAPERTYTYPYPRPSVTVDCVVFGFDASDVEDPLKVLLIRRKDNPFKGRWALPGGFVNVQDDADQGEDLEAAARRELAEETSIEVDYLEQLYTFGAPKRDPRGRVISVAYLALVRRADHEAHAGSDASDAVWTSCRLDSTRLAFDHDRILAVATERLRTKVRYAPIGFNLLPEVFTLSELRRLYEGLLGRKIDPSNFRKKMLTTGVVIETGDTRSGQHRPSPLFRFDPEAYEKSVREGFNFEV